MYKLQKIYIYKYFSQKYALLHIYSQLYDIVHVGINIGLVYDLGGVFLLDHW